MNVRRKLLIALPSGIGICFVDPYFMRDLATRTYQRAEKKLEPLTSVEGMKRVVVVLERFTLSKERH